MIYQVLKVLKTELDGKITETTSTATTIAEIAIGDIAKGEADDASISDKIVITLLNIEEEKTLKNSPRYQQVVVPTNGTVKAHKGYIEKNPAAYLNLYVMITANRSKYENALLDISQVIEIFQDKKVLTYVDPNITALDYKGVDFKIQLHSLPFDQLSYAWGLLGGKVMPSVLYKISVIKIQKTGTSNPQLINAINIKDIKKYINKITLLETLPLI
jgi:hypothetical protein